MPLNYLPMSNYAIVIKSIFYFKIGLQSLPTLRNLSWVLPERRPSHLLGILQEDIPKNLPMSKNN